MGKLMLSTLMLLLSISTFAQESFKDFEVPKDYKFEVKEDYAPYEKDIMKAHEWLLNTPLNKEKAKRKEVSKFVMKWIMGSPNVMIELRQDIVTFMDSPDLLLIFMSAWTNYALENRDFKNKFNGNLAGIEAVIEFYQKNKSTIGNNKDVKKYIKLQKKGRLSDFIAAKL